MSKSPVWISAFYSFKTHKEQKVVWKFLLLHRKTEDCFHGGLVCVVPSSCWETLESLVVPGFIWHYATISVGRTPRMKHRQGTVVFGERGRKLFLSLQITEQLEVKKTINCTDKIKNKTSYRSQTRSFVSLHSWDFSFAESLSIFIFFFFF